MRFELTDDEVMLRDMARDFVARTVGDAAGGWDHAGAIPARTLSAVDELGLGGLCAPEAAGGAGLSLVALAVVLEELAVGSASLAARVGAHAGPATVALAQAPAFKPSLRRAAAGSLTLCWLGDGLTAHGTIEGRITAAVGAEAADLFVGLAGDRVVAVPRAEVTVDRDVHPLGLRASGRATVTVAASAAHAEPISPEAVATVRAAEAVAQAAVALGAARGALEATLPYTLERKQFGKPIADFQAIQWMIADSATELDAARLSLHHAAEGEVAPAHARLLVGQVARKVTDRCIQMHGGYGYTTEYPVERAFRDAHHALLMAGPDGGRAAIAQALVSG